MSSPRAVAVTSIPPLPGEEARKFSSILRSWQANGFTPLSVNFDDEELPPSLADPGVAIRKASRADGIFKNRYGPSLGSAFAAAMGADMCCFINADIRMLRCSIGDIVLKSSNTLFAARRVDIRADGSPLGVYGRGIDAMFFKPEEFKALREDEQLSAFQFGAPFWDIILPVIASFHGRVAFIRPPLLIHYDHPARWSDEDYRVLRRHAIDAVFTHARRHAATSPEARRFLWIANGVLGPLGTNPSDRELKSAAHMIDLWLKAIERENHVAVDATPAETMREPLAERTDIGLSKRWWLKRSIESLRAARRQRLFARAHRRFRSADQPI